MMNPRDYMLTGVQRIADFKKAFLPNKKTDNKSLNDFINLFCEYQLADNNYQNIHQEATQHQQNEAWFAQLSLEDVLRYITYIIWTDKFVDGFILSKIKDKTMYYLLSRLENVSLVPAACK